MDYLIYSALSGARATWQRQEALSHNLANAATDGFRAETMAFRSAPIRQDGTATTRVFGADVTTGFDPTQGPMRQTHNPYDVAINGDGWMAVQDAEGNEAYQRGGALQRDAEGTLRTARGDTVLGDGGPITIPAGGQVAFGQDGSVNVKVGREPAQVVGRLKLVNPPANEMERRPDGLMRQKNREPAQADPAVRLADGVIEGSNVNMVETMVDMIATSRQFELQTKLMKTAEDMDRKAARLFSGS